MLTRRPPPRGALSSLLLLFLLTPALALAQGLRFTTLDVGQGDAAVLIAPSGCAALFDGGPTGSGASIKSYLKAMGVTRVDMAFISHLHADHLGGIDEVEQGPDAVPITAVYDHGGAFSSVAYTEYNTSFSGRRVTVSVGQTYSLCGEVTLRVVAANGNGSSSSDENAKSVVVKISYGAFDALVGGDLTGQSPDIETRIAQEVGELELYKVHHHGSRSSSNDHFLGATRPLVSFISLSRNNIYGHPAPECVERLTAHGSGIWQTQDPATQTVRGHIELSTWDGDSFTVEQGGARVHYLSKGVLDTPPPTAPGALVAWALSPTEVELSWSASTDNVGVEGYRVYRRLDDGGHALAGTSTTLGFVDLGLKPDDTYWYQVTAVDAAGNESTPGGTWASTPPSGPARVILNEILANEPGSNTAGEFVELLNVGGQSIDISGWVLLDADRVRHTFAAGTVLRAGRSLVVFGGASAIPPGMSDVVAASTGTLSLNNSGDTVTLRSSSAPNGTTIDTFTYGGSLASVDGVSMNRNPDAQATGSFVLHTKLSSLNASPGTRVDGGAF
jgi:beta-lactamase superfamily II metal-dependent hydrolase